MKNLSIQVGFLVKDIQAIDKNIAGYNPGLSKEKVPLRTIQYDIASLARGLSILHGKIGEKIREGFEDDS